MFQQIKVTVDGKTCPVCKESLEWTCSNTDNTEQQYMCLPCRIFVTINGMSRKEQEEIAEEAFE